MSKFHTIRPEQVKDNVFKKIGREWMLLTAGTMDSFNTMTAGWGGFGVLWRINVCICFIRPSRYTYEFIEKSEYFTLSFFESKYKEMLTYMGTVSSRHEDKIKKSKITPAATKKGSIYFEEAELVFDCKKIYFEDISPDHFLDKNLMNNYPDKDYHRMYIGEIKECLKKVD